MRPVRTKLKAEFFEASVDWITVTTKTKGTTERLRDFAMSLIDNQNGLNFRGRSWFQSGFSGVMCGHVQYGERGDEGMLRLGGYMAHSYWLKARELSDNVTRFDLQVTMQYSHDPSRVVHKHYREMQAHRRGKLKAPRLSRVVDDDGGYTVYTGRRCSNVMGRIYDKESESKLERYARCVRYEVQFSGERARWVSTASASSDLESVTIARSVLEFMKVRGARVHRLLVLLSAVQSIDITCPTAGPTDLEKVLNWFKHSIAPSVRRYVDRGHLLDILKALSLLDHVASPGCAFTYG